MEPSQKVVDDLQRRRIEAARDMTPAQRIEASLELYELGMELMIAGIRHQYPGFTPEQVDTEVARRIEINRRLDQAP